MIERKKKRLSDSGRSTVESAVSRFRRSPSPDRREPEHSDGDYLWWLTRCEFGDGGK